MTAESRGWRGRAGDEEGSSRRTPDLPPRDGQWTQLQPRRAILDGFGFLNLKYRDGEKIWSQVAGTEGHLVAEPCVIQPCPGICLLLRLRLEAAWSRVRSGGIVPQLGSPVSKLVHYYSQMQPPATSRQPPAAAANIQGSGAAAAVPLLLLHATPGHLTLLLPLPAACSGQWPGDGTQNLGT